MELPKFSVGVGDRFAQEAKAQLRACVLARNAGVLVAPVWNKSNREHTIIGSDPIQTRVAADAAADAVGWTEPYFVDADHITLQTYARYVEPCDFFTIDVADLIGTGAAHGEIAAFVARHPELQGVLHIPGIENEFALDQESLERVAGTFLAAVQHAGKVYRMVAERKGVGRFVTEISMDETTSPQTPPELLVILAAVADEGIPLQTIAPKFTGRFNKGVDYVGDVEAFAKEFHDDVATVAYAVERYGLPPDLKLSVHSGSDKFSIYPAIRAGAEAFGAGVHVKTAGTTWLEEVVGLAESGGGGLGMAKEIYAEAYGRADELCAPYATVIDIDRERLPRPEAVRAWTSEQYVRALRHDARDPMYNPSLRQLLHVGFKVAAHRGERYLQELAANREAVERNVTENLWERHLRPLFVGSRAFGSGAS